MRARGDNECVVACASALLFMIALRTARSAAYHVARHELFDQVGAVCHERRARVGDGVRQRLRSPCGEAHELLLAREIVAVVGREERLVCWGCGVGACVWGLREEVPVYEKTGTV